MQMINEILADLRAMDQSPSVMRKFGFVSGGILIFLGALVVFANRAEEVVFTTNAQILGGIALLFILLALIAPALLKPVNSVMVVVALTIGWFITRLVLIILFYLVFFPMGVLLKVMGKDNLRRTVDRNTDSYWIARPDEEFDPARCRRLF